MKDYHVQNIFPKLGITLLATFVGRIKLKTERHLCNWKGHYLMYVESLMKVLLYRSCWAFY